jgi:hypothetical protein
LIGGLFLTIVSVLVAAEDDEHCFLFFAAAANGIQHGITSTYSANLIRSTHLTGTSTDIGLFIGQLLRGNRKNIWKLLVLIYLAIAFWLGGLISLYVTARFTRSSLLFNAALFLLTGVALVYFLVVELHVSVRAAVCGTWIWRKVFEQLEDSMRSTVDGGRGLRRSQLYQSQYLHSYFDSMSGHDDELDEEGLHNALEQAGIQMSKEEVHMLMKSADKDGNMKLSKEEWVNAARGAKASSSKLSWSAS